MFGRSYDDLWKAIIRPRRDLYEQEELGPYKFEINEKCYKRTDFELINNRGLKLLCSFWEPFDEEREKINLPCVIYLHGNSSSRCEAYSEVRYLLPRNVCLFSFDFCGCGKSEGEYISLGYYEKEDVQCVVDYLLKSKKVSKIGLWGRSMGAVTAIMYASENPSKISALVLDSGFYSLNRLIHELVKTRINLPSFIIERILKMVKETVKEKAGFNLDDIEPYLFAKKCNVPVFFCHGKDDNFVSPQHCIDLFNDYKGDDKFINIVKGNHNTSRPREIKIEATKFIVNHLKEEDFENDETISNSNTNHRIIFNSNRIILNYNNTNNSENTEQDNEINFYKTFQIIRSIHKNNLEKEKINNKYSNTNYQNRYNTDESGLILNKNASQNMRAYSNDKYSKNNLKLINRKNNINNIKNIDINMINMNRNTLEENKNNSNSSSSNVEDPSFYSKKSNQKETIINPPRIRSFSVNNSIVNKGKIKLNNSYNNRKINNKNLNINILNKQKNTNYNLPIQSTYFMNNILKENNNYQNDKNINHAGKTFTNNFFKNKNNKNNKMNNYFTSHTTYFNNYKGIDLSKKNEDKNSVFTSKRPSEKENSNFYTKIKNDKKHPINLKNNQINNKIINKNLNDEEEKLTINSKDNTILDENEEIKGRNIPH